MKSFLKNMPYNGACSRRLAAQFVSGMRSAGGPVRLVKAQRTLSVR